MDLIGLRGNDCIGTKQKLTVDKNIFTAATETEKE